MYYREYFFILFLGFLEEVFVLFVFLMVNFIVIIYFCFWKKWEEVWF